MSAVCKYLPWDSEFFGYRIARALPQTLTSATMGDILAWCEMEQIDCLYLLTRNDDPTTTRIVESAGCMMVDQRLTLSRKLDAHSTIPNSTNTIPMRQHTTADLPALRAIAGKSFTDSRFYYDAHFPRERCDALYERWIELDAARDNTHVLIADVGQVAGFITCVMTDDGIGEIGLVGVADGMRGRGIGSALVNAAVGWFAAQGVQKIEVVTQARNIVAQRTYQRNGFLTETLQIWYHRWFINHLNQGS
jgi:dTDP-4-amino-4,6-dideoxy-D-galactose acyltransferase